MMIHGKKVKKILSACVPYGFIALYKIAYKKKRNRKAFSTAKLLVPRSNRSPYYIITLTSHGERIGQAVPYAIASLLNQTVTPDRIILWLGHGTTIPRRLTALTKKGLEIRFCEDVGPHTKLVHALVEFPNDILISVDDDMFYPPVWFEQIRDAHIKRPQAICAHRAHEICLDGDKNVIPYSEWRKSVNSIENIHRLFPTGVGGVLYPPDCLDKRATDSTLFKELTPSADDVWFWAMAQLKGTEYSLVKDSCRAEMATVNRESQQSALWKVNVTQGRNDIQISNVLDRFPELRERFR